jgi:hypothetical protein
MPPHPEVSPRSLTVASHPEQRAPESCLPPDDPRLDTTAWRVFGRRFPRRWTLYFRVVAVLLLLSALAWWFTRDVTYVDNVKVSGLEQLTNEERDDLRTLARDFAAMVGALADAGYAWQSGALPALRATGALTSEEAARYLAIGSLEVKGGPDLARSAQATGAAETLRERGWILEDGGSSLHGARAGSGRLAAKIQVAEGSHGRQRVVMEVTRSG